MKYISRSDAPPDIAPLVDLMRDMRCVVLTGAGCSTESGIPDYRGPKTREKTRNPIQYREFVTKPEARQRYWSRSAIGWPAMRQAEPNAAHEALAKLERSGVVRGVITQNVDRLHHHAGSERVVELHGALAEVCCLSCEAVVSRDRLQERLLELNPDWQERGAREIAPDGDAELARGAAEGFRVPDCSRCGGVLKPNVVFFGENVPAKVVEQAWLLFEEAEVLLVVGSSLAVYSGYRFVRRAADKRLPTAIVNLGETRGHPHAWVSVDGRAGDVLPRLADALIAGNRD